MDTKMNRRAFLGAVGGAAGSIVLGSGPVLSADQNDPDPFQLPDLPYEASALEPYIDSLTMEIHHGKHHAAYVSNLNKAVEGTTYARMSLEQIMRKGAPNLPAAIRNNGGGHANHSLFWQIMAPNAGGEPTGGLRDAIVKTYGSFGAFREKFEREAKSRFGSGWAWLAVKNGKLECYSMPNQDNPWMQNIVPILGLDVWEHAYYLKYQNRRPDYISAWWEVVNWNKVEQNFYGAVHM